MKLVEVQVDRIVGPTHHFGGLGVGNVASLQNKGSISNPRAAALQGLEKMRLVAGLGVPQVILPPQERPLQRFLQALGFNGSLDEVLPRIAFESPEILSAAMSSSAMWTANAATVAASVDSPSDSAVMTIANLCSSLHRAIEPSQTQADLWTAFPDQVQITDPLPGGAAMRDEGAANHMRLGSDQALPGVHVFVYGDQDPLPKRFWPRQTLAACQAIARRHQLPPENTFFLKQHPDAIDAGAFHNDVVAASHHHLLLHHETAFFEAEESLRRIENRYKQLYSRDLIRIEVSASSLAIDDAIATYLFNSQIISPAAGGLPVIICPMQVSEDAQAQAVLQGWLDHSHFTDALFIELRQSMAGGGGPACLRLRVPLTDVQLQLIGKQNTWSPKLDESLRKVIRNCYPESLCFDDLSNAEIVAATTLAEQAIATALIAS